MKLGSAYWTSELRLSRLATAAGSSFTSTTLAPTPRTDPTVLTTPVRSKSPARSAVDTPSAYLTITSLLSYFAAWALPTHAASSAATHAARDVVRRIIASVNEIPLPPKLLS